MDHHAHHLHAQVTTFAGFWLMGFLSSFHCLGMCGPLSVLYMAREKAPAGRRLIPPLLGYHISRMASYAAIGFLLHLIGLNISSFIPKNIFILLIFIPFCLFILVPQWPLPSFLFRPLSKLTGQAQKLPALAKGVAMGLLTPLIPCGLLYAALAMSLLSHTHGEAALKMALFGLGTALPMMAGQLGLIYGLSVKQGKYFSLIARIVGGLSFLASLYFFSQH